MKTLLLLTALLCQDKPFPDADPGPAIEAAKKKAAAENQRVLAVWGMNEPDASLPFVALLKKDKALARLIQYEYVVVLADIRRMDKGRVRPAVIPLVDILDAEGRQLASTSGGTDAALVIDFLKKHQATPWKAQDVLDAAKKKAAAEKKRVLLTFGAPW